MCSQHPAGQLYDVCVSAVVSLFPSATAAASQPALVVMGPDPTHVPDVRVVYVMPPLPPPPPPPPHRHWSELVHEPVFVLRALYLRLLPS